MPSGTGTYVEWDEEVVVRVEQGRALAVHRDQRLAPAQVDPRLLGHHDRLRLDPQAAMLRHDVEAVHPVAEVVDVTRSGDDVGLRVQPEAEAVLILVVAGPEADLVVALGDGPVVVELGDVEQSVRGSCLPPRSRSTCGRSCSPMARQVFCTSARNGCSPRAKMSSMRSYLRRLVQPAGQPLGLVGVGTRRPSR